MNTRTHLATLLVVAVAAIVVCVHSPSASARPNSAIIVNALADTSGGPTCTLRDAIAAANNNAPAGGCPAGNPGMDTITFSVSGTITLTSILPDISEDLKTVSDTRYAHAK